MPLYKYISKFKLALIFVIVFLAYFALSISTDKSDYSFFQHPYITMLFTAGFMLLIFQFDFNNIMFISRFKRYDICHNKVIVWLSTFAIVYSVILFIFFLVIGLFMGDVFTLSKIIIFLFTTTISLIVFSVFFVMLSAKISLLFARLFLFGFLFASFASNFAGGILVKANFAFFNINTTITQGLIINSLIVYTILVIFYIILSISKDREQ